MKSKFEGGGRNNYCWHAEIWMLRRICMLSRDGFDKDVLQAKQELISASRRKKNKGCFLFSNFSGNALLSAGNLLFPGVYCGETNQQGLCSCVRIRGRTVYDFGAVRRMGDGVMYESDIVRFPKVPPYAFLRWLIRIRCLPAQGLICVSFVE